MMWLKTFFGKKTLFSKILIGILLVVVVSFVIFYFWFKAYIAEQERDFAKKYTSFNVFFAQGTSLDSITDFAETLKERNADIIKTATVLDPTTQKRLFLERHKEDQIMLQAFEHKNQDILFPPTVLFTVFDVRKVDTTLLFKDIQNVAKEKGLVIEQNEMQKIVATQNSIINVYQKKNMLELMWQEFVFRFVWTRD